MKANEIIEAIRNGNAALYRSKKDRTIGIISEGVHNKQSVKDQRGCLAGRYQPCLLVLSGPGVAVRPEQVERTGYAARIIAKEIKAGNLPAESINH